jgi:hypothetical protein
MPQKSQKASLVGAWQASLGPRVAESAERVSYTFMAYGSYRLTVNGKDHYCFLSAPGLFTDVIKDGRIAGTDAIGPCEFKDADGDLLRSTGIAKDNVLYFDFHGGTGKWSRLRGKLYVTDTFTYNDGKMLCAFETAEGELEM